MAASAGFVSVPVMPTFAGMSKEFADKLEKPAKQSGERAGKAMSAPLEGAVTNLERQVKASSGKLDQLDRAHEKSISKREQQQDKLEASTLRLEDAENKYKAAIEAGDSGLRELARVKDEKARVAKATDDLRQAEIDVTVAERKHKDQLDDLNKTTAKYEQAQSDLNDEVGKSKGVFGGLKDSMGDLAGTVSDMPGPIGSVGDMLSSFKMGPTAGVMAVAGAVGTASTAFFKFNEDLSKSSVDMQNTFGLTADDARDFQGEIAEALGSGLGGYEETAAAVMEISQTLGDNVEHMGGQTAAQLADDFMAFNQTFERSAEETASTVDVMLNSGMVSSAQEGIDLLTSGMQQVPAAMQDEVFDAMNEYSKHFSNLGIDGSEAMSMLVDAAENGQYAIDKTGDAIKEFSVLAIDPAKAEAFETLGLNADEMANAVAGGGDSAKQALQDAAQALLDMEDPGARAATAVELFGAPIEDLGVDQIPGFLESLTAGSDGMGDFAGSAQEMADNTKGTFSGMVSAWKGQIHGWAIDATLMLNEWGGEVLSGLGAVFSGIGDVVGGVFGTVREKATEWAQPVVDEFNWAKENIQVAWEEITKAFNGEDWGYGALASMIGADNAEWVVDKISSIKPAWEELTSAFSGGDWGYGALSNLVGADNAEWVVDKVSSVIPAWDEVKGAITGVDEGYGGLASLIGADNAEWVVTQIASVRDGFIDFKDRIVEGFGQVRDALAPVFEWLQDFVGGQLSETFESLKGTFSSLWDSIKSIGEALGGAFGAALEGAFSAGKSLWEALKPVVELLGNILLPILKIVGGVIGGVVVGAVMAFIGAIRFAAEVIEFFAGIIQWLSENVLSPLIGFLGEVAGFLIEHVAGAVGFLVEKFAEFGNYLIENFWPAVQSVMEWVGGAFSAVWDGLSWAYENIIKPVFDAIWWTAQVTLAVIGTAILGPLLVAWNLLSAGIQWGWENYIKPTWEFLQAAAVFMWENVLQPVFGWIQDGWQRLADGIAWVYENIILGTWNALQDAATWMYENVLMPVFGFIQERWEILWGNVRRIYFEVIKPTWDALQAAATWMYENVLRPVFQWIGDRWTDLSNLIRSIYNNVIKATWDALGDALTWLYENVVQPVLGWIGDRWTDMAEMLEFGWHWIRDNVFDAMGRGLETLRGWFETGVEAIKSIWDGLREAAAAPVRFVVDAVWNNGLRKALNFVLDLLPGFDTIDPMRLDFNTGGVLPGYTPGRDPYTFVEPRTGMRIGLSGGEAILRPEATRALGEDWVNQVNAVAKRGGVSGVQNQLTRSHFADGGVLDLGNFNLGGVNNMAGALSAIQASHARFVGRFFPGLFNLTSAMRFTDTGHHSTGKATDWQGTDGHFETQMPSPASKALARAIFTNFPNSAELIHWPLDGWQNLKEGAPSDFGPGINADHANHVHWATHSPLQFDGDDIVLTDIPSGGGWFNPVEFAKNQWDKAISAIGSWRGEGSGGFFDELPGEILSWAGGALWDWAAEQLGKLREAFGGGGAQNVANWSSAASEALRRAGYDDSMLGITLEQVDIESSGDPTVRNDWDSNAAIGDPTIGLLQVRGATFDLMRRTYPEAFEGLPNDRTDPVANMTAGVLWTKYQYGGPQNVWPTRDGYADGGIIDLSNMLVRDFGGLVPHGAVAINTSGRDEMMLPPETTALLNQFFAEFPEVAQALVDATTNLENAAHWLEQAASPHTEEGVTARQSARRFLDLGLDIPGAEIITAVLDGEDQLLASRARHVGHLDNLAEKEAALEDARRALAELAGQEISVSEDEQKKLDDAKAAMEEAKAEQAKADSDEARAAAADKLADAEANLTSVREDLEASTAQSAEQHATDLTKANEDVVAAEQSLVDARKAQVKDLDHLVLVSHGSITGLIPQAEALASQIIGMGAPTQLVAQGLGAVTGGLMQIAGLVGPAGITLGMAFDAAKIVISLIQTIVGFVRDLIEKIRSAHIAAVQAMADGWQVIADYAALVVELQGNVSSLQQEIVRGLNEQRVAEFQLRVAQQDRLIAEAESSLAVAEARLALDREIERGNIAAQLRLMGLHEDWDSYLSYQALVAGGVLDEWSDAAISALFTYEATRAQALRAELSARVDQINAEAQLAAITRQNTRNQQDLLKAQERLIRMSADVAGVDLVDATATSQVAKIIAEMAEIQQKMDSSLLGRLGVGAWGVEHRGRQAELDSYRQVLHSIAEETGVAVSDAQINQAISQMKRVGWTDGDPMAVLRGIMPELVEAETALRMQEYMGPIWDAQDQRDQLERDIEDFESEIDLFEQTQPLEETLAGLDYTIASLEQAAQAWADGNEGLRGDYLAAARAQWESARELGVDWQLDGEYATPGVRDQITKEVTIHMDGSQVYTADQVDALLAEVTSGSNVRVTTKKSSTTVANARREGGV